MANNTDFLATLQQCVKDLEEENAVLKRYNDHCSPIPSVGVCYDKHS